MVQNKNGQPDIEITPSDISRFDMRQMENILYEHPGVDEVAVLYVGDDTSENKNVVVFIAPREPGMTKELVFDYLKQRGLRQSKQLPGEIRFVQHIPKTPSGKVLKMKLLESLANSD